MLKDFEKKRKDSGGQLTSRQEKFLLGLLKGDTLKACAESCGVSECTGWRWLQLRTFQRRYRSARRQVVERAVSALQAASSEAVETLRRSLHDGSISERIRAAQIIIDFAIRGVELIDLEERIDALEHQERGLRAV